MKTALLISLLLTAATPLAPAAVAAGPDAMPVIRAPMVRVQANQPTLRDTQWDDAEPVAEQDLPQLIGMPVAVDNGREVGRVLEFVRNENDEPAAVVEVGRELGLGDKTVAIPLAHLRHGREVLVISPTTSERLDEMRQYDPAQYRSLAPTR